MNKEVDICTSTDGVKVRLEKSILYFSEGFESDMSFYLSSSDPENKKYWSHSELLYYIFRPRYSEREDLCNRKLKSKNLIFASEEKVRSELYDLCVLIEFYLLDCINGDFTSWVDEIEHKKKIASERNKKDMIKRSNDSKD